jgi:hypothetical protein
MTVIEEFIRESNRVLNNSLNRVDYEISKLEPPDERAIDLLHRKIFDDFVSLRDLLVEIGR